MAMVCSAYGREHGQLKRNTLVLSVFDLVFILSAISFVIIQLVATVLVIHDDVGLINATNINEFAERNALAGIAGHETGGNKGTDGEPEIKDDGIFHAEPPEYNDNHEEAEVYSSEHNEVNSINCTSDECKEGQSIKDYDPAINSRAIIGARISLSIQLIIYLSQLGFGILLFIAAYHNDSQNLHLWVLFNEVIVVVIALILFIHFFGNFHWVEAILTGLYVVFKIMLIRLVRRFIHVNDLQLTQFGSVGDFD